MEENRLEQQNAAVAEAEAEVENAEEGLKYTIGYNPAFPDRQVFPMFTSSDSADAWAGDREMASATKTDPFNLMMVSVETNYEQEKYGTMDDSAFVMLCGSIDFVKNDYITSNVYGNGHTSLFADMMDAIEHDRKPYVDAVAGRNALEMILAIYQSAATGKPVKLPLKDVASTDFTGRFG
mgnify:CR=1 FL=1